ncbi:MAG: aldo/keto reductase [Candidatus Lambdaproteobacteria bacterium RIFOXYD1_FULL_56_27]|uniref:Aldo/keto reductase n=1 Tax=Candidatus Lambdaproteobacteria bacterium RIFOXYD2_FULL_56_26 TaxID=1817773 RepID=A0A1F6GRI9_9PROT|nr:MAG: aldo/keto reductase [Candidatus Lambdaproteobacteria bacterium RIFOXYC1_FULL_56_13]OGH00807.1 MAG: aldo/keto reductase [Candidatus Lambdaproteobacteria bacterium RIFOXYD2_FULL_56_26]OGH09928.1 MAG: aldo/keto reductase [Candidatus Lambdaproteobacteria bacterium RIFOXYD1_FULL_56_27]
MLTKRFGQTELQMPVLTCGGMRFQHRWQDIPPETVPKEAQANLEATLERAFAAGINHFETARGYGSSEMQLGWALPRFPREKLILQTKVPPTQKPDEFLRRFDQSLTYLGVDFVDLLSIHGLNDQEQIRWTLQKGGALEKALSLKEQGRVGHVGFSTHAPPGESLPLIELGVFEYVNLHWYYIYPSNRVLVEAAQKRDMGVLVISPNDKGGKLYQPNPKLEALTAPLSPMEFNDLYCLSHPGVHTLSIGAAKPQDFEVHLQAVEKLEQAQVWLEPVLQRLQEAELEALGEKWQGEWWQGIAPYYDQPGQINVQEILRFWFYDQALGLRDFAKARYNMLGKSGHWFPGQKSGELDRQEIKKALAGHPLTEEIIEALVQAHQAFDDSEISKVSGPKNSN